MHPPLATSYRSESATGWTPQLRVWLFGIGDREATFARRGFHAGSPARERLEGIGRAFLRGYRAALAETRPAPLAAALDAEPAELRGFGYEGAAMALALLDALTPWRRGRVAALLAGPGGAHAYMVHVGAGWALARLRRRLHAPPPGMDPLLGWLALDGYGFHEAYFHPARVVGRRELPGRVTGYARRAYDQGVGRALWFVHGADAERVAACVAGFGAARAGDLWSGVGLACAYAGGAPAESVEALARAAGTHRPALAQGAAFAAGARDMAGNPAPHTDEACRILCGSSAALAAAAAADTRRALAEGPALPAYELWRRRLQSRFSLATVSA